MASSNKEIESDFMLKRAINKSSIFTAETYKERWFTLTETQLNYHKGTLAKRGKLQNSIPLSQIKTVEMVEDQQLDDRKNVFQVMHRTDNGEYYTLYVVAQNSEQQKRWVDSLKAACRKQGVSFLPKYHTGVWTKSQACRKQGVSFLPKYHTGVWTKSQGHYNCCSQIDRNAPGCQVVPDEADTTSISSTASNPPPRKKLPELPINGPASSSPSGTPRTKPVPAQRRRMEEPVDREKKLYIAAYDYRPCEEGDLELVTGSEYEILDDSRDHWWYAKNDKGQKGYIPANYVKKKFDLEIYEWYYKGVTRERSEAILKNEVREGCFMVRDSSTAGMYTLSIYTNEGEGTVRHYHIKKNDQDKFYLAEKHSFLTIPDLIYYHKHNAGGIATRLRCPPSKNKTAPVTAGFGHSKWELDRSELTIFEILGSGCFGTVHKGKWNNRVVAVKSMKERTMSEDAFLEEAKTMTQLNHPHLVQLYGVVTKSRPLIIVTELMQYGSLLTFLKRHKSRLLTKLDTLVDICIQVSAAMEYLEGRSFIHRDLAARNCLVGDNQIIKVADFGLARYVIDDEYTSSTGTKFPVKWAPPEVLSYTRFSSKSDVWAFGVLMWEVFTGGQMPYDQMRNADVVDFVCHMNKRLAKPQVSPERTYKIMLDCWHKDPDSRPSFVQLSRILNGLMDVGNYPQM